MSFKERLLRVFRPIPEQNNSTGETDALKAIQRETGEDFPTAVERYREYLQKYPDSRLGRAFLVGSLRMSGKWDDALAVLREQQQLESAEPVPTPNTLMTRLSIGQVLYDKGEFDAAITEFESVLTAPAKTARPLHGITYLSLGTVHLAKGQPKEARTFWKKAIQHDKSGIVTDQARELLKNNPE